MAAMTYLGFSPLFAIFPKWRASNFINHHYRQAAILFGVFLTLVAVLFAAVVLLSYLLVNHREFYERTRMEVQTFGIIRKFFLAWTVFWVFGLGMALLGGTRLMPLVHRLASRDRAVRAASGGLLLVYALGLAIVPLAVQASRLVPVERETGKIYMVYEDNGIFPRWLFALAFYPMAKAAEETYGVGSAVLLKISPDSVATALQNGRLVFIGSHGTRKGLMLKTGWLLPADLAALPKNKALKFVYLTGCDSGELRDAWVAALQPAEVITYDRLSASLEHAWWLWFRGPDKVRAVHAEDQHAG